MTTPANNDPPSRNAGPSTGWADLDTALGKGLAGFLASAILAALCAGLVWAADARVVAVMGARMNALEGRQGTIRGELSSITAEVRITGDLVREVHRAVIRTGSGGPGARPGGGP